MKKTTLILLFFFCAGTILLPSCATNNDSIPTLQERKKATGPDEEKQKITDAYDKAIKTLAANPEDLQQYINLATVFIAEGRITGNSNYYSNAAIKMLNKVTDKTTGNKDLIFQSLSLRSAVLLNMHQFGDALKVAQQGAAMNDFNSGIFGALVDANVELGNYDEAVKACDKMISVRPDLRSYSRASYLRQIYGMNRDAIDAMKMAVEAGMPGAENTEWARTTLGDLYLNIGNLDSADFLYHSSLVYRPDYAFANMGLARVEKAKKNYDNAIAYTKKAIQVLGEASFAAFLGDLYELKGDVAKAGEVRKDVIRLLEQGQKEEDRDALVKHNVSRELATAYLNAGELTKALKYAQADLDTRPNNIDANELAAWIYYLQADYANAKKNAEKMLATNTKNANTLYKAGLIYAASGDPAKGQLFMQNALAVNQYIDQRIVGKSKPAMASIK